MYDGETDYAKVEKWIYMTRGVQFYLANSI